MTVTVRHEVVCSGSLFGLTAINQRTAHSVDKGSLSQSLNLCGDRIQAVCNSVDFPATSSAAMSAATDWANKRKAQMLRAEQIKAQRKAGISGDDIQEHSFKPALQARYVPPHCRLTMCVCARVYVLVRHPPIYTIIRSTSRASRPRCSRYT